jgi:ribonuclease P protein component
VLKFTKQHKLRTEDFKNIFQNSRRLHNSRFTILFNKNNEIVPRIGIIVSKKQVQKACARNRIKRLLRESFRLNQFKLPKLDIVVLVKKECLNYSNSEILEILRKTWEKLERLQNSSAS